MQILTIDYPPPLRGVEGVQGDLQPWVPAEIFGGDLACAELLKVLVGEGGEPVAGGK